MYTSGETSMMFGITVMTCIANFILMLRADREAVKGGKEVLSSYLYLTNGIDFILRFILIYLTKYLPEINRTGLVAWVIKYILIYFMIIFISSSVQSIITNLINNHEIRKEVRSWNRKDE